MKKSPSSIRATVATLAGFAMMISQWSPWLLAAGAFFLGSQTAEAASYTWNGLGADSLWQTGSNWIGTTAPATSGTLFFSGATRLTSTNNFAANTQFNGLNFNSGAGAFVLSGSAIKLGGDVVNNSTNLETINFNMALQQDTNINAASGSLTLGGTLSGAFAVTKQGSSTLTLSAANTFTSFNQSGGLVAVASNTSLGTGTVTMTSGTIGTTGGGRTLANNFLLNGDVGFNGANALGLSGTVNLGGATRAVTMTGANDTTLSGVIANGALNVSTLAAGNLILSNANNTYSGGTTLTSGTLSVTVDGNLGGASTALTFNGGTLILNGNNIHNFDSRTVNWSSFNGGLAIAANSNVFTIGNNISGSGSFTLYDGGTLYLTGSNSFSGGTTINQGVLEYSGSNAMAFNGRNVTVNTDGAIQLDFTGVQAMLNNRIKNTSAGTIALTATNAGENINFSSGGANMTAAFLGAGNGFSIVYAGTFTPNGTTYRLGGGGGSLTFSQNITGANSIIIGGGNTIGGSIVILTGSNSNTGGVTVTSNDDLQIGPNALGSGTLTLTQGALYSSSSTSRTISVPVVIGNTGNSVTLGDNGNATKGDLNFTGNVDMGSAGFTLTVVSPVTVTVSGTMLGTGGFTKGGNPGTLILTASNTISGLISVNQGLFQIGDGATAGSSIVSSGTVKIGSVGSIGINLKSGETFVNGVNLSTVGSSMQGMASGVNTVSGVLAGVGSFNQIGTGATILTNAANTYTGATTVSTGTLQLGNGTSGVLNSTGTVSTAASSVFALNMANNGSLANSVSNLGMLNAIGSGTNTISGTIAGSGTFNQLGTGRTILSAAETYTGVTNVSAGVLQVGASERIVNTNTVNVTGGAFDVLTFMETVGQVSTLTSGTIMGSGTLALNNVGNTTTATGTSVISSVLQLTTGTAATRTFSLTNSGDLLTISGTVTQGATTGSVTKAGNGTLIFTGADTYTGATSVTAGNLQIGNGTSGSISTTGTVSTSAGAVLAVNLANVGTFANNVIDNGQVNATASGANTISGVIVGTGTFNQNGSGTTTLSGSNSYSGATNINGGVLTAGNDSAFGASRVTIASGTLATSASRTLASNITVGTGGGTIDSGGGNIVVSGSLSGSTALTTQGANTVTLNGGGSYSGTATVAAGTLAVNGSIVSAGVSVNSSATLKGTGSVGAVSVSGTLSAGSGSGTGTLNLSSLTLNSGAHLALQVSGTGAGTQYNRVSSSGAVTLGNNIASLDLTVTYNPTFTIGSLSGSDRIYLVLGSAPATGSFSNVTSVFDATYNQTFNEVIASNGSVWAVFYGADHTNPGTLTGGNDIALYAIPEPNTWAMLLGGFGTLVGMQRFRRRKE